MQTYYFAVFITGEDVQDAADALREDVIGLRPPVEGAPDDQFDVHVTEAIRVVG